MFVMYDPAFRNLTGTSSVSQSEEYEQILAETGVSFIQVAGGLPGSLDDFCVDADGDLCFRNDLPEASRLADIQSSQEMTVPAPPELPEGGVTEPPVGTQLSSGTYQIRVRAPYCRDYYFTIRIRTPADIVRELLAFAANLRWELMQQGATWNGHKVATDDVSQSRMTAAVLAAQLIPNWSTNWQFLDGSSATIYQAQMIEIAIAAQTYVNDLFMMFDSVKDKILSGEYQDISQINEHMDGSEGS